MLERVRGWVLCAWPFIASAAAVAVMVAAGAVVLESLERDEENERLAKELKAVVEQTKASAEANRRLIERGNPCLPGDDPHSEACIAQRISEARLADALAAVQAQHDEQARQVDDAVNRLIELQERQHGVAANAGSAPRTPTRTPPRITAGEPTPTTAAPEPATATTAPPPEPATTTTVCEMAGKSGRCRK